jgi:hypothetical protein
MGRACGIESAIRERSDRQYLEASDCEVGLICAGHAESSRPRGSIKGPITGQEPCGVRIRQFGNSDPGVAPPARAGLRLQSCRRQAFLASLHIGESTSWLLKTNRSLANGGKGSQHGSVNFQRYPSDIADHPTEF